MNARLASVLSAALALACVSGGCASTSDGEDIDLTTYLHNGQGYAEGGHYDQALSQFRQALRISSSNPKALLGEATCLYWLGATEEPSAGRYILEAEEKAGRLDPSDYGENAWKVHLGRGMIHARLAELYGRKAELSRREGSDAAALLKVKEYEGQRDMQDSMASKDFDTVLSMTDQPLAKDNLTALFFLATRSAMRATDDREYARAISFFSRYEKEVEKSKNLWTQMVKQEPKYADLYGEKLRSAVRQEVELRDLMANIYFKQRMHDESIAELDRVIEQAPYRATAYLNRGRNYEELGRFGAAADDYRRFLKATDQSPSSSIVIEASDRMLRCEEKVRENAMRDR